MNWIKKLIIPTILLLTTSILVFSAEFVLREKIGLGEPIVYDEHPLWGYSPKPNAVYSRLGGSIVTINNVGLRSTKDWQKEQKNILFLGDSVTYGGSHINDDETFSLLVCKHLTDWNCHNGGVNAYGILNMVARSRYDKRIQDDDLRVFTFISRDFDRGLQKATTAHFILREPPRLFPALWEVTNYVASMIQPNSWFGKQTLDKKDTRILEEQKTVNRRFALDILASEIHRLKTNGKNVILVHSPSMNELKNPDLIHENLIINRITKEFPNDLLLLSKALEAPFREGREGLFKDVVHFEAEGHSIIAQYLANELKNRLNH
jgi:lysophospholipase L1-like esterase